MSVPKFPGLFISIEDRDNMTSIKKPLVFETIDGTITPSVNYAAQFSTVSQSLKKTQFIKQLTMTIQKINGHGLLNTTFDIGTIPVAFRPVSNVSSTFAYGGQITDVGQINLTTNGALSIRTGDTAYFGDGTSTTITLLYL